MSRTSTYLISSIYFSLAHAHHLYEHVKQEGIPLARALPAVLAQVVMTFVFGMYSCYVYLSTGGLLNAVALHTYCNYLGPPNLSFRGEPYERTVGLAYIVGLALFWLLFFAVDLPTLTGSVFYL